MGNVDVNADNVTKIQTFNDAGFQSRLASSARNNNN